MCVRSHTLKDLHLLFEGLYLYVLVQNHETPVESLNRTTILPRPTGEESINYFIIKHCAQTLKQTIFLIV